MTSGGTSMFPGFSTRLDLDLRKIYKNVVLKNVKGERKIKIKIEIKDPPRRKYSVFMGAGVYANAM
jgi:actin-related protein 2